MRGRRSSNVDDGELVRDAPQSASIERPPHNFPAQLSSFVGRTGESVERGVLLASTGQWTVIGAGGCGKSRLALHLAANALDAYAGGVWFVDLAPLSDPALVDAGLAATLGVRPLPGRTPLDAAI